MRVLITGVSGFVGGALACSLLDEGGYRVRGAARRVFSNAPAGLELCQSPELEAKADWSGLLQDVEVVVHAAARVHMMNDQATDPLSEFRRANTEGSLRIARQAVEAGVRRFVFISSIKVNGEESPADRPYSADDVVAPVDPYGVSKHEAEQALLALARETGLEVVIIRPVLVYGPGVKANFQSMMRWLDRRLPLPLGAIHNSRSLVFLDNLVDLIVTCLQHSAAAGQVFLVSDGAPLSTTQLLRRMGLALGKPARLLPISAVWLQLIARLLGRPAIAQRLCGSLCVDIEKTRRLLGWEPPVTVDEAMSRTARYFQEHR